MVKGLFAVKRAQEMGSPKGRSEPQLPPLQEHGVTSSADRGKRLAEMLDDPICHPNSEPFVPNLQIFLEQRRHHQRRTSSACHSCSLKEEATEAVVEVVPEGSAMQGKDNRHCGSYLMYLLYLDGLGSSLHLYTWKDSQEHLQSK